MRVDKYCPKRIKFNPKRTANLIDNVFDMQYGDLIFFYPSHAISKLIPLVDGSPFSHVAMFTEFIDNKPMMIESQGFIGIQEKELDYQTPNFEIIRPDEFKKASLLPLDEVRAYIGTRYDYSKILEIILHTYFKKPLNRNDGGFICSEFINMCYGYLNGDGVARGTMTPKVCFWHFADVKTFDVPKDYLEQQRIKRYYQFA